MPSHFSRRKANRQPFLVMLDAGPNPLFQRRIERDDVQPLVPIAITRANGPRQPLADVLGQHDRVFRAWGTIAERFQNRAQLANRHALAQQAICNTCCTSPSFITPGINSSTTAGEVCRSSSIRCFTASRVSSSSACWRTVSLKCAAMRAARFDGPLRRSCPGPRPCRRF